MNAVLLAIALQGSSIVDQGVLIVRRDTSEVARETFRLSVGRPGTGGPGWTLASTVRYDRVRPPIELAPILEIGRDSAPMALQYDVSGDSRFRILGEAGPRRFTIRVLARSAERAREYPADRPTVVLDDSVFAPYVLAAWHARAEAQSLLAIIPRSLRSERLTVASHGEEVTTLRDARVTLHHVTVRGGPNQLVHVWRDAEGRLMKIEIPSRRLRIERARDG